MRVVTGGAYGAVFPKTLMGHPDGVENPHQGIFESRDLPKLLSSARNHLTLQSLLGFRDKPIQDLQYFCTRGDLHQMT